MKTNKIFLGMASLVVALAVFLTACTKNGINASRGNVSVFLTDGPGDYDSVFIDITKVEGKVDNDSLHKHHDDHGKHDDDHNDQEKRKDGYGEWVEINYTPAVIDVLSLRNGVETKLGDANIAAGTVRKIRITLGSRNRVVKDSVSYPLQLKNETNNLLYVKLYDNHRQRGADSSTKVWVDFDIARSIEEKNDTTFYLRPVLRPFCNANFGEVEGVVLPLEAKAVVRITNGAGFDGVA